MRRLSIGSLALGQPQPRRRPGRWTAYWLRQLLTLPARSSQSRMTASEMPIRWSRVQDWISVPDDA